MRENRTDKEKCAKIQIFQVFYIFFYIIKIFKDHLLLKLILICNKEKIKSFQSFIVLKRTCKT